MLPEWQENGTLNPTATSMRGSLNEPYIGEKGMISEAGTRIPFIMNWPNGLPKGEIYDRPVVSLDIAATSLALDGEEVPEELDGVNVIPYINGEIEGDPHEALYWRFWHQAAIRMGDWKFLKFKEREFLFNVGNDVHENVNLISEHPEKAEMLKEKLNQWASELKYPGLEMEGAPEMKKCYEFYFSDGKSP